jgi:hypothetical protein
VDAPGSAVGDKIRAIELLERMHEDGRESADFYGELGKLPERELGRTSTRRWSWTWSARRSRARRDGCLGGGQLPRDSAANPARACPSAGWQQRSLEAGSRRRGPPRRRRTQPPSRGGRDVARDRRRLPATRRSPRSPAATSWKPRGSSGGLTSRRTRASPTVRCGRPALAADRSAMLGRLSLALARARAVPLAD